MIMELRKTNENVTRSYDAEGQSSERVDSINYEVLDRDGNVIGSASVNSGNANLSINLYGFASVEEGERKLMETLGLSD